MHALVIEPQIFTSFMIEDALRDSGYTSVTFARTEEEAISAAQEQPPQIITAAVRLDQGSGVRAVHKIRATNSAPVVFITQQVSKVPMEEPDILLVRKPFPAADLLPAIAEAKLRRSRARAPDLVSA
jgi:DNA-binding response OmpR family regulator